MLMWRKLKMDENAKRMLRLAELSMTLVGDPLDIFQKIASMIAEVLKVPLVCLSEIRGDELYFLSIYNKGEISTNAGHCLLNIFAQRIGVEIERNKLLRERSLAEDALRRSEASLVEAQRVAHLGSWDWNIVENKVTYSVENC